MSGGGLDAGGSVGCVRVPAGRGSASVGSAVVSAPGAGGPSAPLGSGGGALLLPPALVGELILGSRLGSLTQIRHDKEGESGLVRRHKLGRSQEGVNSADGRICALKSRSAGLRFAQLDVLRRLRVKWVRRAFSAI